MKKPFIFISYSHSDKQFVTDLVRCLREVDVECFLDEERIQWGERITDRVREALKTCIAVVVIISPSSLKSQWVPFEIGHAMGANSMGANKMILPLLTHEMVDVPDYLREFRYQCDIDSAVAFFQSETWKNHVTLAHGTMSRDLTKLREDIKNLLQEITFLESGYLPGRRDPEEL